MAGIAVIIVVSPHYLGGALLGGAIGIAIRIRQRQRQAAARQAGGPAIAGLRRAGIRPWEMAIPEISTAAPTG
jgi:hypothetical protein